jgi:endogenous inhibitor of DNA gyrase (YacG/DUF329 family)
MAMLQIKCPNTGQPVDTGMDMPHDAVKSGQITLTNNTVGPCPHCGESHTWSGDDVL